MRKAISAPGDLCIAGAALLWGAAAFGSAEAASAAKAKLIDTKKKEVGTAELVETAHGVLIDLRLEGVPEGKHALHIHETGKCEPPFKSAGGHFNPEGKGHGFYEVKGMHVGDLPNIHMGSEILRLEILAHQASLRNGEKNNLLDADGSAIVIHAGADDYRSDPAGNAGDRIACGVIEATEIPAREQP